MAHLILFEVLIEHLVIVLNLRHGFVLVLRHHLLQILVDPLLLDALFRVLEAESELLLWTQTRAIAIFDVLSVQHARNLRLQRVR